MEKRTPHYPLARVKALVQQGRYRVTRTTLFCSARDFGLIEASELAACVMDLHARDFHKSMTTLHDHAL